MRNIALFFAGIAIVCGPLAFAQKGIENVTRQPDAYNTWKLALSGGKATDPAAITVPDGFKVELLRSAEPAEDSWVSMAFDPQGRVTIACEKKGLLRMTLGPGHVENVERINDTLLECRGLLYADGVLYADANNSKMFVRLRSSAGDGRFDEITELLRTDGGVGHGRNHVKLSPDGLLTLVHGNNVVAPSNATPDSPLRNFQDDRLIPCPWDPQMFDGDVKLPAGHILRADREQKNWTLLAGGLRNPLDVAFNVDGEMFTFDADMEWDTGTPWYRPCRINHIISGADYGWRRGTSKWPEYFPDCGPTVLNIGLASPTGIEFGTKSDFPSPWHEALFISDWAYGRIIAVHLKPSGASYTGTAENFVVGKPLNVTDVAFGPDGAMYFITGGRHTQSGLYRVSYSGPKTAPAPPPVDHKAERARALRHGLEAAHGHPEASIVEKTFPGLTSDDPAVRHAARIERLEFLRSDAEPGAVKELWRHLGSDDPAIRHAARIALEWQDVKTWQDRALAEKDPTTELTALMALARSGKEDAQRPMFERLNALPFATLTEELQILAARDYQLAFIRLGPCDPALAAACRERLEALYPARDWRVNHLLCELLAYLKAPSFLEKTMTLLAKAERSEDLLEYLFYLRLVSDGWTLEQRKVAFTALNRAATFEGARDYQRSLNMIRAEMLEKLTPAEHEALAPLLVEASQAAVPQSSGPQIVVRDWKPEDLEAALARVGHGRSFDAGRQAFAGAQCILCHRMGQTGGLIGPDLTAVSSRFNRHDILDSIINPSRVIDDKFRNTVFTLKDGTAVLGTIEREDDKGVVIRTSPLVAQTTTLRPADIVSREVSTVSPMPPGLINVLSEKQILDLLAYLESGGDPKHPDFAP